MKATTAIIAAIMVIGILISTVGPADAAYAVRKYKVINAEVNSSDEVVLTLKKESDGVIKVFAVADGYEDRALAVALTCMSLGISAAVNVNWKDEADPITSVSLCVEQCL